MQASKFIERLLPGGNPKRQASLNCPLGTARPIGRLKRETEEEKTLISLTSPYYWVKNMVTGVSSDMHPFFAVARSG